MEVGIVAVNLRELFGIVETSLWSQAKHRSEQNKIK
jgi:hypothetical protein